MDHNTANLSTNSSADRTKLTVKEINKMDFLDFVQVFGSVIEYTPLIAASVWTKRPFSDLYGLHKEFAVCISDLSQSLKTGLLRCYPWPDLAGKLAEHRQMPEESIREHTAAGLKDLKDSERNKLRDLNECYKQRFQFPFVVCLRETRKDAIEKVLRKRLNNSVKEEIECGTGEITRIALYRLTDLVEDKKYLTSKL